MQRGTLDTGWMEFNLFFVTATGMPAKLLEIGLYRAVAICQLYSKVRRNEEEIQIVLGQMNDYMKYMSQRKKEVKLGLMEVSNRIGLCNQTSDGVFSLQFSESLKVYAIDPRDAGRNNLYLRGVQAILKRSERYYEDLERKGAYWFRQYHLFRGGSWLCWM